MGRRWGLLQASWTYQGRQFFETSTLHGVRYIAEKGRPFHERLLWFISTTAGLMAALVIIDSLWDKFQTSPTITGLDSDYHSWDVPFPALTVCLQDPANGTLIEEYIDRTWPDATGAKRHYYSAFLSAITNVSFLTFPKLRPYLSDPDLPQTDLRQLSYSLFSKCHAFIRCAYKENIDEEERDCCSMFYPVFTENGFCFAFNLNYTLNDCPWELKRPEFTEDFIEETDARWSLTFETDDPVNNSVAVYISSSYDLPGADVNPQHIWNKRVSKLLFVPKMTYTSDGARELSIKQRGCVFPDEIRLRVAPIYTFSSCMRQCRMEKLMKLCGCLPIFYTLLPGQRYCSLPELGCIIDSLGLLTTSKLRCPCQLGCEHTMYDMEKPHEAGGEGGSETGDGSNVEVGFLSWPLTRYKREVLFGHVDLLVAVGTIAGLFLGFSLLSGLEIVYYFTLRAWCMLHTERNYLEELSEEYSRKEKPRVDLSLRPSFMKSASASRKVAASPDLLFQGQEGILNNNDMKPAGVTGPPMWKRNSVLAENKKNKIYDSDTFYPYFH